MVQDERWVEGLAPEPLLARVERRVDDLDLAFYARKPALPDAGAPVFVERARFRVPIARVLDDLELMDFGAAGRVLALTAHADDPADEPPLIPTALLVVGGGPKVLFEGEFARSGIEDGPLFSVGGADEGFSLIADGGAPEILLRSESKRVPVTLVDGGAGRVELGHRERLYRHEHGKFSVVSDVFREFARTLELRAPGHVTLVDGKPDTSEKLTVGDSVKLELPEAAHLQMLRVVPGCLSSESAAKKNASVNHLQLQLDDSAPIEVTLGQRVDDPRLFGAGELALGSYGVNELLVFAQPQAARTITVKILGVTGKGQKGCLAEIAAY